MSFSSSSSPSESAFLAFFPLASLTSSSSSAFAFLVSFGVSDFFDFSVYIDAEESVLREWYVKRWLTLRDTAFHDPRSYFHRYAPLSDEEAIATATAIWERTNRANLEDNILPTRPRAILRTSARSSGRWTKESATQSTSSVSRTASRSAATGTMRSA